MRWMKLHALVNLKFKAKSARLNVAIQSGARKDILVEFSESKHVWNTGIYVHKQNRTHPSQELTHPFKELCHPEILVCKRPPSIDSSIYETDVDGMASGMTIFRIPDRWFSLQGVVAILTRIPHGIHRVRSLPHMRSSWFARPGLPPESPGPRALRGRTSRRHVDRKSPDLHCRVVSSSGDSRSAPPANQALAKTDWDHWKFTP